MSFPGRSNSLGRWRDGRADECTGLENQRASRPRGFESPSLRHRGQHESEDQNGGRTREDVTGRDRRRIPGGADPEPQRPHRVARPALSPPRRVVRTTYDFFEDRSARRTASTGGAPHCRMGPSGQRRRRARQPRPNRSRTPATMTSRPPTSPRRRLFVRSATQGGIGLHQVRRVRTSSPLAGGVDSGPLGASSLSSAVVADNAKGDLS